MKNAVIFLHGKGKKPNDPQYRIFEQIAAQLNADLVPITALTPHRDGFRWHNANKQSAAEANAEFAKSMSHIESELKKILAERNINYGDVIYLGHSQGGDMAIRAALKHGAKMVVVLGADISDKFPLPEKIRTDFSVIWVGAGHDDVLDESRRASYKILQKLGVKVTYIFSPDSTHEIWDLRPCLDALQQKRL